MTKTSQLKLRLAKLYQKKIVNLCARPWAPAGFMYCGARRGGGSMPRGSEATRGMGEGVRRPLRNFFLVVKTIKRVYRYVLKHVKC